MPNNGGFGGGFGKDMQPISPKNTQSKPNENLTSSLRASLKVIENENEASDDDNPIPSPLEEATPDSVDVLLERINNHMIEGKILSDEDLRQGIDLYRSQALRFAQEQQTKKPRAKPGSRSTLKQILDLDEELL